MAKCLILPVLDSRYYGLDLLHSTPPYVVILEEPPWILQESWTPKTRSRDFTNMYDVMSHQLSFWGNTFADEELCFDDSN